MTEDATAQFAKDAFAARRSTPAKSGPPAPVLRFPSPHAAAAAADDAALAEAGMNAWLCLNELDHDHRICGLWPELSRAKAQTEGWLPLDADADQ